MAQFLAMLGEENHLLENLSYLSTLVGVPVLLISYITSLLVESHRREVGTYDTLETQYVDFQKAALNNPLLDVADSPLSRPPQLSDEQRVQQRTLYMILFSLFERAYLMYRPTFLGGIFMGGTHRQQWQGWVSYIDRYFDRQSCREAWFGDAGAREDVGQDFDRRFERFVWRRIRQRKLT